MIKKRDVSCSRITSWHDDRGRERNGRQLCGVYLTADANQGHLKSFDSATKSLLDGIGQLSLRSPKHQVGSLLWGRYTSSLPLIFIQIFVPLLFLPLEKKLCEVTVENVMNQQGKWQGHTALSPLPSPVKPTHPHTLTKSRANKNQDE